MLLTVLTLYACKRNQIYLALYLAMYLEFLDIRMSLASQSHESTKILLRIVLQNQLSMETIEPLSNNCDLCNKIAMTSSSQWIATIRSRDAHPLSWTNRSRGHFFMQWFVMSKLMCDAMWRTMLHFCQPIKSKYSRLGPTWKGASFLLIYSRGHCVF